MIRKEDCTFTRQMLPTSHAVPMIEAVTPVAAAPGFLREAFAEFIAAAERLEVSYSDLQTQVVELRRQLAESNVALTSSRAKNERMQRVLQQILSVLPCGVLVSNSTGTISLINPEARRLLDVENADVRNMKELAARFHPGLLELYEGCFNEFSEQEISVSTKAGVRWIAVGGRRRVVDADLAGANTHTILTLRDITDRKRLEEEREAARNTMALAEMSAILAHEIRNPLASLELFIGLIKEQNSSSEHVAHLQAGIRMLSATVNNVLRFYNSGSLHLVPQSIVQLVESSVEFLRPIADQAGVNIILRTAREQLQILGDESAFRQVLLNLARNAISHMAPGGQLTIAVRKKIHPDKDSVVVRVSDTGSGIKQEDVCRIFEPGFSGNGQTPGLGLTVCNRIMEQHGGSIQVASQEGRGTTFYLEFATL